MAEPEVFDWDEWEHGKTYELSNDELVGALLSEVSALRQRVKALEDRQAGLISWCGQPVRAWARTSRRWVAASPQARDRAHVCFRKKWRSHSHV